MLYLVELIVTLEEEIAIVDYCVEADNPINPCSVSICFYSTKFNRLDNVEFFSCIEVLYADAPPPDINSIIAKSNVDFFDLDETA